MKKEEKKYKMQKKKEGVKILDGMARESIPGRSHWGK